MSDFSMGQRVKVKGKIGSITAIYDKNFTPGQYPKSDYRVTFGCVQHSNVNQYYAMSSELEPVKTVKAFAFKHKASGEYYWKSNSLPKKGYARVAELDVEKELIE